MSTVERTLEWECKHADFDSADNLICRAPGPCPHMRYCEEGYVVYPEVEVEVDYTPGDPGRVEGPMDYCYPPSGPEIEIIATWFEFRNILNDLPEDAIDEDSILDEIEQDIADDIAEVRLDAMLDRYDHY